jgi:hypothetical protein
VAALIPRPVIVVRTLKTVMWTSYEAPGDAYVAVVLFSGARLGITLRLAQTP